uniref:Uncharacterized protein n=1 Tax=Helianthus annuus TaxID=4232 RepID=A0A251U2F0_HELAN
MITWTVLASTYHSTPVEVSLSSRMIGRDLARHHGGRHSVFPGVIWIRLSERHGGRHSVSGGSSIKLKPTCPNKPCGA